MQAAVGNLPVTDVYLSPSTKKLLVRLADTCERSELKHILIGYQWHWVILCCHRVSGWLMHQYKCLRQKRQSDHFYFIFFLKPCILVFDMAVFKRYWLFIVLAFCHSIIRITLKRLFLKHYIHDLFSSLPGQLWPVWRWTQSLCSPVRRVAKSEDSSSPWKVVSSAPLQLT